MSTDENIAMICALPCHHSEDILCSWNREEDAAVMTRLNVHTILAKVLIIYGEWALGRTTVVLVREPVGV